MNLIQHALFRHRVVVVISLILLAAGIHALLTMPRRATPEITIYQGLVVALYPGATPQQVEEQLTAPLERHLFAREEIDQLKTTSDSSHSQVVITVTLKEWVKDTDRFWSELQISLAQLRLTSLPDGVIGPVVNSDFGDVVALLIGADLPGQSQETLLRSLEKVADGLRALEATGKVAIFGYQPQAIYVSADSQALVRYGVSLEEVIAVLRQQNSVRPAGKLELSRSVVPLHVSGSYNTIESIRRQRVLVRPDGREVTIGDLATLEQRRSDPDFHLRINGGQAPALFLSVEMQPDFNIVTYGSEVRRTLEELRPLLPPGLRFTFINDQPAIVAEAVDDFIREFLIAIAAVIMVIMMLLPIRVAAIAVMAIPVTIAVTFQLLNLLGIPLHEVSLASMIVVLGMVVDDAVVIADNYVEKLDQGLDRYQAAWRSATELFIPVLTATLAIIAAFAPLGWVLSGAVGEFILALPITVAVALSVSFAVAMLLTPHLCSTFIHSGIKQGGGGKEGRVLGLLKRGYGKSLGLTIRHPLAVAVTALLVITAGVLLLLATNQKLFPAAERAQCIIEVDLELGSSLVQTDDAVRRVEELIAADPRVTDFAAFVGTSPPRVYYSFAPEFPRKSYGCLLVNTSSPQATVALVQELQAPLETLVPEARINLQMFDQGPSVPAPLEIRVAGYEVSQLEEIGARIAAILSQTPGTRLVRTDYRPAWFANLKVDTDTANIRGFTTSTIAQMVRVGIEGLQVSTLYDGERSLPIIFRLDERIRHDFTSLGRFYLRSRVSGAILPLEELTTIQPRWTTGQISRRNGIRTLAVLAHACPGAYPESILREALPAIRAIPLPPGYRLTIGGEHENVVSTFAQMGKSLIISSLLIFLILLIQFGNVTQTMLVMLAIPLTILGAATGLLLTGNPLGFTASIGIASLIGIVIRNSIILVDYTNELILEGMAVEEAVVAAALRRMRPIFLTSLAAAVGVVPMMLSGSPLWAPLASVFAVGVLFSMVMTLLVIPVAYNQIMPKRLELIQVKGEQGGGDGE
ncbi:efflux RND transporter permease subunit [Desulfogranum mediterraneum]|uniref:efflux RND transporter permease subunit n=1 Tax=Desulfogranum mediterraneum TaxID=160661 RepID=UPI000425F473|nr:efflux RND transporter permease subunit [Desulfogranum mediterraneum]